MSYDVKTFELARAMLRDHESEIAERGLFIDSVAHELAKDIQRTIESYIFEYLNLKG